MKKFMKYQLRDMVIGYSIYAAVMTNDNVNLSLNGNGFSSVIFCFVCAIAMYKEQCQLAVQNSISRKDFFRSSIFVIAILSLLCAFVDLLLRGISLSAASFSAETTGFDLSSFMYCIALPIIFCGLTPVFSVIAIFSPGPVRNVMEFLLDLMGINSGSPFRGMMTITIISLLMGLICYRILKKTEIV